jgi:hypothetical protein
MQDFDITISNPNVLFILGPTYNASNKARKKYYLRAARKGSLRHWK